ncbi:hypothetical protein [Solibacillus sp. CAU 1738]|uniref:hypothetical protein n=1 Tax=Solibacillus sp. CAU 1738 TaxID=3140363 RepID=UPI0032608684
MKKILPLLTACFLLFIQTASAHTMNEGRIYEDIDPSATNAQHILLVNSLGLVGYNGKDMILGQDENLSRMEFAAWIGGFFGLEGTTFEELANASLHEEYIKSLEGDVTYQDINIALFHNSVTLENPEDNITKADYVEYIYNHLNTDMGDHTLLQMGGFAEGPTGVIEDVKVDEHETAIVIGGTAYPLSGHPRVSAKTINAEDWIGKTVELSYFVTGAASHSHSNEHNEEVSSAGPTLQYVQLQKEENVDVATENDKETQVNLAGEEVTEKADKDGNNYIIPIVVVIIIALVGIVLWKRKSNK